MIYVGTAGWSVPFSGEGTHLERYGTRLNAAEINTSFYHPHRRATYEGWAASVPEDFRFSVKLPKSITHERRLVDCADLVERFAGEAGGLGRKFGVLLVQLPPSLSFNEARAGFLKDLRSRFDPAIALEPRHETWFTPAVEALLEEAGISRVAADPSAFPGGGEPGGDRGLAYFRLHGSPHIYHSRYDDAALAAWGEKVVQAAPGAWVIFDNTAEGAAFDNATEFSRANASGG